jgi:hypothetical protein
MKPQLKKQDMVVGKEYKGYAWRNEYGEFFFRPSAVGSRAGRLNKICEEEDFSLNTTTNLVLIHIKLPRLTNGKCTDYIKALGAVSTKLINAFMKYEI